MRREIDPQGHPPLRPKSIGSLEASKATGARPLAWIAADRVTPRRPRTGLKWKSRRSEVSCLVAGKATAPAGIKPVVWRTWEEDFSSPSIPPKQWTGVGLGPEILRKIYWQNAYQFFGLARLIPDLGVATSSG